MMDKETLEKICTLAEDVEHWDLYERISRTLEQHFPKLHDRFALLYDTQTGEVFLADEESKEIIVFLEGGSPGEEGIYGNSYKNVFEFLKYENRDSIKASVLEGAVNQGILDGEVVYGDHSTYMFVYEEDALRCYVYHEGTGRFKEYSENELRKLLGCAGV